MISWQNGIGEVEVLHRQRVDARRRVHDVVHRRATRGRTRASSTPTRRAARRTGGRTPTPSGSASVRSMWQRQIHLVSGIAPPRRSREEAEHRRGLRVVDDDEVPLALEQQRVVEHLLEVDALHLRRSTRCRRPAGALCTALVTAKNSSLPWITCHSASMPRLAEQRHVGGEQLGDTAAVRGGVDVQDPGALRAARPAPGCARSPRRRRRPRSRRGASRAAGRVRARTTPRVVHEGRESSVNLSQ